LRTGNGQGFTAFIAWTFQPTNTAFGLTEAEIARNIQDAGFVPKRGTMRYEIVGDPYCWSHATPELPAAPASATSLTG